MILRRRLFIMLSIIFITILFIPKTYAYTPEDVEAWSTRLENANSKSKDIGLSRLDTVYITPNIDIEKAMPYLIKFMIWDSNNPYQDNPDNDDVFLTYEIRKYPSDTYLITYFKKGLNQDAYSRMTRVRTIDAYDNAEYIIAKNDYDLYTILLDGKTYNNNLGFLFNDGIKQINPNWLDYPNFGLNYDYACDPERINCYIDVFTDEEGTDYQICVQAKVGFNYTVDSYTPHIEDSVDDDYIYGGDEDNKLDDTPTEKEIISSTKFDAGKVIGIIFSIVFGIVILYLGYVLIIKIYEIVKG